MHHLAVSLARAHSSFLRICFSTSLEPWKIRWRAGFNVIAAGITNQTVQYLFEDQSNSMNNTHLVNLAATGDQIEICCALLHSCEQRRTDTERREDAQWVGEQAQSLTCAERGQLPWLPPEGRSRNGWESKLNP